MCYSLYRNKIIFKKMKLNKKKIIKNINNRKNNKKEPQKKKNDANST